MRDTLNQLFDTPRGFSDHCRLQFELYEPHPDTRLWGPRFEAELAALREWGLTPEGSVRPEVLASLDAYLVLNQGVQFSFSINMMTQFEAEVWGVLDGKRVMRRVTVVYMGLSATGIRLMIDATRE